VCVSERERDRDIIMNVWIDRPPPPRAPTRMKATPPPPPDLTPPPVSSLLLEFTCPCNKAPASSPLLTWPLVNLGVFYHVDVG
jgi:hypothetical protein